MKNTYWTFERPSETVSVVKAISLMVVMLLSCLQLSAQKLTVESLEYVPNDAAAASYETQMQDINGNFAGVVKVYIALDGVQFEGGGVLKQEKHGTNEYWVWMAQGSNRLKVIHPSFLPLEVNFRMYEEVKIVKSKLTYKLVITVPVAGAVQQDDGNNYLLMRVEPKNAFVYVDGQAQNLDNAGELSLYVPKGVHEYKVSAPGYADRVGSAVVGDESNVITIRLESTQSTLSVTCPTNGAQVYVNNQLRGTVPWTGTLPSGHYQIEARLTGYRSHHESVTLGKNVKRSLAIPGLVQVTGILNVNYKPIGCEVYVDGQRLGSSPHKYTSIGVGSHKVEIRKDGYVSASQTVTVKENATAELSGSLTAVQSQNTANNTSLSSNTTGTSSGSNRTFTANGVSFNMVYVQGGMFTMGATSEQGSEADSDEKPTHSVTLSSYYIGETEVTQELWQAVMGSTPSYHKDDNLPVERVSWDDCQTFINKLNQLTGKRFRLPTEAEWEYAARGGNKSRGYKYSGSNSIDDVVWYGSNSGSKTHAVKTKQANELGLYDMSGNVYEWCQDWYDSYSSGSLSNPTGAVSGYCRVFRCGGWGDSAGLCRVSNRYYRPPSYRSSDLGFRLAL